MNWWIGEIVVPFFDVTNRLHKKYSLKIRWFGIRDWWNYLMNHTKICLSSSEIITPFFVNCVKIADWLGSNSLAIWSLCLSSSFWILLLEPAMIFFISKLFWSLLTIHFLACWNIFTKKHSEKSFSFSVHCCWHMGVKRQQLDIQTRKK